MILVCGATGMLGSRIAARLRERDHAVRALVRASTDASALEAQGIEVVRGDVRDRASLDRAVQAVEAIVSTVNTVARASAGEKGLTIRDVDQQGHANLIEAAEAAGVKRFVFLSFAEPILASNTPFARAKLATEDRLRRSRMRAVIVRPEMFQEVWLTELVGFDWKAGKLTIFGQGRTPHRYVAVNDVARGVAAVLEAEEPPEVLELAGPEAMTRVEAADAFERATGRPMKRSHVPRPALRIGSRVLAPFKPLQASLMGMALASDLSPSVPDDAALRAVGIEPRPVSTFIREAAAAAAETTPQPAPAPPTPTA